MTGQLFQAIAQHRGDGFLPAQAREFVELLRRDAEAEKGALAAGDPTDDRTLEERSELVVEELPLLAHGARLDEIFRIDAVQPCESMAGGNETAKQAGTINVAPEDADAPAAGEISAVPIGAGCRIELRREEHVVGLAIRARTFDGEEPHHVLVARQVAKGRQLQPVERDVMGLRSTTSIRAGSAER